LAVTPGSNILRQAQAAEVPAADSTAEQQRFHAFLESLFPQALAKGINRTVFDAAFRDLTPDPSVARASGKQSEFERPFSAYFSEAVSERRITQGRALAARWQKELIEISRRSGVPASILLAAWGMESDFGGATGGKDVIRSLATLAFEQPERPLFRDELLDALVIVAKGAVPRAKMTGSWAGAMGGPQFLPSTYLAHAVSFTGAGAPDIWTNTPDILASIAAFLRASGWEPGAPWGMEVRPPAAFDYGTLHADYRRWTALGFTRAGGGALPGRGAATLFFPEGAGGPAFLLGDNYWVIKTYNISDAYALSFACLADRIAGDPGLQVAWPKGMKLWARSDKAEIQRLLQKLGYYKGIIDGRFGPTSRDAIHAFQIAIGDEPADGVGKADLLERLRQAAK
jgi:membrane-bound lytic murein transglycosylase B